MRLPWPQADGSRRARGTQGFQSNDSSAIPLGSELASISLRLPDSCVRPSQGFFRFVSVHTPSRAPRTGTPLCLVCQVLVVVVFYSGLDCLGQGARECEPTRRPASGVARLRACVSTSVSTGGDGPDEGGMCVVHTPAVRQIVTFFRYSPPSRPLGSQTPTQPEMVTIIRLRATLGRLGEPLRWSAGRSGVSPSHQRSKGHALPSAAAQEHVPAKGCHLACIQEVPRDIS